MDVNDLLSKLISNGIIKPSQPDATATASNGEPRLLNPALLTRRLVSSSCPLHFLFPVCVSEVVVAPVAAPPAAVVEEEEEEEQEAEEDEDLPDLTSFTIDDMKQ